MCALMGGSALGKQVTATTGVFHAVTVSRSSRAFSWGESGRQKLRDYVVGLKEVPVEFDTLAEPAREMIDGAPWRARGC